VPLKTVAVKMLDFVYIITVIDNENMNVVYFS